MAFLKVVKGSSNGQLVVLPAGQTVLGRQPSCQIVIDDGAVSRRHAGIFEDNGKFFIEDLRSRNGTEVNNTRILTRMELRDGDEIRVCDHAFLFLLKTPSPSEPSSEKILLRGSPVVAGKETAHEEDDGKVSVGPHAVFVPAGDGSSVISALEASSTGRGLRLSVRPEAKLRAVLEISSALGRMLNLQEVLPVLLKSLFKIFDQADWGFVLLQDHESDRLQVRASLSRRNVDEEVPISMTVVHQAMKQTQAILSADAKDDSRFKASESIAELKFRSLMCAPLLGTDGKALGVIQLSTQESAHPFDKDDLDVLVSVTAQAGLAVENATLHDSLLRQRDIQRDMEFAAQVQHGFLPSEPPKVAGYEFADYYKAAYSVGGDYFDYVPLLDGRICVAIGDVAGKGVSAALLMARLHASARYHLLSSPSPGAAIGALNNELATGGLGYRMITLVFAVIDPRTNQVLIANAGHMPPAHRTVDGKVKFHGVDESGLPLGVQSNETFRELSLSLQPGESLLFYTDGITEAMNSKLEMFGSGQLATAISVKSTAAEIVKSVVKSAERFCGSAPQRDDICVTAVRRVS